MFAKLQEGAKKWNFKRAFRKMWEYTEKGDEVEAKKRAVNTDTKRQLEEI